MKLNELIGGAMIGAGLMYMLDPDRGRRRRALVQGKATHLAHQATSARGVVARDLANRSRGLIAGSRSRLRRGKAVDAVIEARVRTELGRLVSHPGAIEVTVEDGRVRLGGPVLAREHGTLLSGIASVKGVKQVVDCLETHESAGNVPGLQGAGRPREPRFELRQENWSPAARLIMGTLGGAMMLRGMRGDGSIDRAVAATGLGVFLRSLTNLPARRLTGVGAGRRAIDIHKTINIDAPIEEVFAFWRDYENLPRFMSHLREVRHTGDDRSHWVAAGPAGTSISWDAETTLLEDDRTIAWKSIGDSPVESAGIVRFEPTPDGGTRIDIRLSYNPPAGAIGHAVASLFGVDPKHALDDDMVRLKGLLESERTRPHGEVVTREG